MGRWHHEREELTRAGGIPWTFLRPCGFMSNAFDWLPTLREAGYEGVVGLEAYPLASTEAALDRFRGLFGG